MQLHESKGTQGTMLKGLTSMLIIASYFGSKFNLYQSRPVYVEAKGFIAIRQLE